MRLDLTTWPAVEAYLKDQDAILIPIGSVEQHGPTGALGTDALCAEAIARGAGEKAGLLVAPTLSLGMALHHMAFPGTIALKPSTLIALLGDVVLSLARHGFRRFLFINGHGGNEATCRAAFPEIYDAAARDGMEGLRCQFRNWWDAPGVRAEARRLFGAADGQHATASEISVIRHLFGESAPEPAPPGGFDPGIAPVGPIFGAADFRRRHPDGRMGSNPGLATAEAGAALFEMAVDGLAKDALAALGAA